MNELGCDVRVKKTLLGRTNFGNVIHLDLCSLSTCTLLRSTIKASENTVQEDIREFQ